MKKEKITTEIGTFQFDPNTRMLTNNEGINITDVPQERIDDAITKCILLYNSYAFINCDFQALMATEDF